MVHSTKGTWLSFFTTACANFAAQYNFQAIAIVLLSMSASQCTLDDDSCRHGHQDEWVDSTASAAVFLGAAVGQLTMGYLGDYFSRNLALCWTLFIAGVSVILTSVASQGDPSSIYATIIAFRFTAGIGLGGVFPLAATKVAEDSSNDKNETNSEAAAWSFFWQLPGFFLPWFLGYCFSYSDDLSTEDRWRLILGLGAIPCFGAILFLLLETYYERGDFTDIKSDNRDTMAFDSNMRPTEAKRKLASAEMPEKIPISKVIHLIIHDYENTRKLIVAGGCWFLFDIVVYGIALLTGHIIAGIGSDDDNVSSKSSIRDLASKQMIVSALLIVVAFFSFFLVSILGLRKLQILAFGIVTFFCILIASLFDYLSAHNADALFGIYCVGFAFLNFGLGATTYALPAALFPKEIRATFNGIAAACGKLGAFVGAFVFIYVAEARHAGYPVVLVLCAIISALAAFCTYYFIAEDDLKDMQASKRRKELQPAVRNSGGNESVQSRSNQKKDEEAGDVALKNVMHENPIHVASKK